jgi:cellulose biosynthesis protein BcsQ
VDPAAAWARRRFRVVTVTSNKGGVGKTTLASNLAVYIRALREELAVSMLGFDDQTPLDRMFALYAGSAARYRRRLPRGLVHGRGTARPVRRPRRALDPRHPRAEASHAYPQQLPQMSLRTSGPGLVVIDTKSDFESLTQAAIAASDLVIVVVKDQASLIEARRVFELLAKQGRPPETARILLSLVDLRVKVRDGEDVDVMAHLVSEIRREGWPLFETFISRSPKIESLYTNPQGRALSVLHGAPQSRVHRQLHQVAEAVLRAVRPPPPPSDS